MDCTKKGKEEPEGERERERKKGKKVRKKERSKINTGHAVETTAIGGAFEAMAPTFEVERFGK